MKCNHCGANLPDDAKFCSNCGSHVYHDPANDPFENYGVQSPSQEKKPESSAGLVLGIISLFFAGIILGILAIVYSTKPNQKNAKAAQILGIIGIIGGIIGIIIFILNPPQLLVML